MRGWWQDLTDLVLPAECGGCGRPRTVLCPRCRAALMGDAPSRVRPDPEPPGLPVVHAAAPYEDQVRAALLAHKERGALMLAGPLGAALAGAVRAGLGPGGRADGAVDSGTPVLLVPVPSARWAVRARGHDPARRIALAAAAGLRRSGTSARVVAVLRQRRAVADQAGLNSRQRLDNLMRRSGGGPGWRTAAGRRRTGRSRRRPDDDGRVPGRGGAGPEGRSPGKRRILRTGNTGNDGRRSETGADGRCRPSRSGQGKERRTQRG